MKVAIAYYSRTGYTEKVVNELKLGLASEGFTVDVYRVTPLKEYSKPLHVNLRLIYDTLVRKGVDIRLEPSELKLSSYDALIIASPIWIGTLSSPIQEFLKRYASTKPIIVTTSVQNIGIARIERIIERLSGVKPLLCTNVRDAVIKDPVKLKETVQDLIRRLKTVLGRQ